jgi:hypothetical protein
VCALYAVVIYDSVLERGVALGAFALILVVVRRSWTAGAFRGRSTLSLGVDDDGHLHPLALVAGARHAADAPDRLADAAGILQIDTDPLPAPVLLLAVSDQGVPPQLAEWRAHGSDGAVAAGRITDPSGELIELPTDVVRMRWTLR